MKVVPMVVVQWKTSTSLHGLNVVDAPDGTIFAYQVDKQGNGGEMVSVDPNAATASFEWSFFSP